MPAATSTFAKPIALPKLSGIGLVAVVLIAVGLCRIAGTTHGAWQRNDFAHYYLSARAALEGDSPYTTPLEPLCQELGFEYDVRIVAGTNPPLLNLLVGGLAWMPPLPAYLVWTLLQTLCLAGMLAMLMRGTSGCPGQPWQWLAVGVVIVSTAVWSHYHYSQVQLLVAFLITSAYFLRRSRSGSTSVALIAIATGLKLYPAVLLPWFLFSGAPGWKVVARRTLIGAGAGLAILLIGGLGAWMEFANHALSTIQNSVAFSTSNYSLQSAASMLTGAATGRPAPANALEIAQKLSRALALAGIAGAYLLIWRCRLKDWRAIGLLTTAMLLASPVCWSHYLVLAILPCWLAVAELSGKPMTPSGMLVIVVAGLCLMSEMDAPIPQGQMGPARTLLHLYPIAALLLFGGMCLLWKPQDGVGPQRVSA